MTSTRPSRNERQLEPQAARLLEQLRSVSEQYRSTLAGIDPELSSAMETGAVKLRAFLSRHESPTYVPTADPPDDDTQVG